MSRVTRLPKMTMPSAPLHPPMHSPSPSSTPTTPLEVSQQLQRVEVLHQQLKAEAQRAQEFLAKLRRGELDAQPHAHVSVEDHHHHQHHHHHHHHHHHNHQEQERSDRHRTTEEWEPSAEILRCKCNRPNHLCPPPPSSTNAASQATNGDRNSSTLSKEASTASLNFPPRVDEREVRDLEKRVRGLEGRVRGFEGLPPDRELALLEVERLRRELEGLARRREGLFEGLGYEDAIRLGRASDAAARAKSIGTGSGSNVNPTGVLTRDSQSGAGNAPKSKKGGRNNAKSGKKT